MGGFVRQDGLGLLLGEDINQRLGGKCERQSKNKVNPLTTHLQLEGIT